MKKTLIALMALAGVAAAETGTEVNDWLKAQIVSTTYQYNADYSFALSLTFTEDNIGNQSWDKVLTLASDLYIVNQVGQYVGITNTGTQPGYSYATRYDSTLTTIDYDNDFVLSHDGDHPVTENKGSGWMVDLGSNTGFDGTTFTITSSVDGSVITMVAPSREITITTEKMLNLNDIVVRTGCAYSNLSLTVIPEPATATLSLLALAGLAARRRRK